MGGSLQAGSPDKITNWFWVESESKSVKRLDSQGAVLTANLHLQWDWDGGAAPPWLCRTSPTFALVAEVGDVSKWLQEPPTALHSLEKWPFLAPHFSASGNLCGKTLKLGSREVRNYCRYCHNSFHFRPFRNPKDGQVHLGHP